MMLKKLEDSVGRIENVCCDIEYIGTYESLGRAINFYLKNGFVEKEELRNSTTHARYYEMILN